MIVDASIAFKWLVKELGSPDALRLLAREDLAAPAMLRIEIGYALTKRVQQGLVTAEWAATVWSDLRQANVRLEPVGPELEHAFALAFELGASFYDCLYLALAIAKDDMLVTADARFLRAVRASSDPEIRSRIRSLAEIV